MRKCGWSRAIGVTLMVVVACAVMPGCGGKGKIAATKGDLAVPVEVAAIEKGFIADLRTYSGTLESPARFIVAPKIAGRIRRLAVDIADTVTRGQVVATLDDDEPRQAVAQAEAELKVSQANRAEAAGAMEIAERELDRIRTLRERGVASEANLDTARAESVARQAGVQVAEARVARDEAALAAARIRLGYTSIAADWTGGGNARVVAERYADEGDTVAANTPLLSIVQLDPLKAVFFVTEREYAKLTAGQTATLATDAWPGESFTGHVARVAPVFREETRQARVELIVPNADRRLKPGMFVKATVSLEQANDATIVPAGALTSRDDRPGIFTVSPDGGHAAWVDVVTGIRQGERLQLVSPAVTGRVITLGQQLVADGSPITIGASAAEGAGAAGADER